MALSDEVDLVAAREDNDPLAIKGRLDDVADARGREVEMPMSRSSQTSLAAASLRRLDLDDMGAKLGGDPLRIGANVVDRPLSLLCDMLSPRVYRGQYNNITL
jgi:hypothetical protein